MATKDKVEAKAELQILASYRLTPNAHKYWICTPMAFSGSHTVLLYSGHPLNSIWLTGSTLPSHFLLLFPPHSVSISPPQSCLLQETLLMTICHSPIQPSVLGSHSRMSKDKECMAISHYWQLLENTLYFFMIIIILYFDF